MNAQFCKIAPAAAKALCNGFLTANGGTKENATVQDVHQTTDSYAAYAQANFHFNDQFFATLGGRYSKDKKDGTYDQQTNPLLASVRALENSDAPGHRRQQVHLSSWSQLRAERGPAFLR